MSDTKEQILTTALHLFARDGFEAVSVSQIAGELHMTKGALYKHYQNKRDILKHITVKMEQDDAVRAARYSMPGGNESFQASPEQLTLFALTQFRYWTEDDFASDFRRLLTIEQYRSSEMQALYQQYIAGGPLSYVESIFASWGMKDAKAQALKYFSPLYLCYSLSDSGADHESLHDSLRSHFERFRWEKGS